MNRKAIENLARKLFDEHCEEMGHNNKWEDVPDFVKKQYLSRAKSYARILEKKDGN